MTTGKGIGQGVQAGVLSGGGKLDRDNQRQDEEMQMGGAFNIVMRIFSSLLGLLVTLRGLVWVGQGLHIGPAAIMRGFMVSNPQWALYGAILTLLGVGQVIWTNTRRGRG